MIFGKTWEEIKDIQNKNYKAKTVDMSTDGRSPANQKDIDLYNMHGLDGLKNLKFFGVIDRLEYSGITK